MSRKYIYWTLVFIILIVASGIYVYFYKNASADISRAQSTYQTISDQSQWQAGTNSSLLDATTTAGSIKINISGGMTQVDTSGASVSADVDGGNASKVIDGNDATGWGFMATTETECHWIKIDLGSVVTGISRLRNIGGGDADSTQEVTFSEDDSAYTSIYEFGGGMGVPQIYDLPAAQSARYVKINVCNNYLFAPGDPVGETELTLYQGPFLATNRETLDGGADFWQWENFKSVYSLDTNTTAKFRFRSSVNGSTWTSWTGYQTPSSGSDLDISSVVTSSSGNDRYRYLQVETTLQNTDGSHSPQVDDYRVDYHTEVKPSAPSAQTAVVQ